ncbi:MAG: tetratricopeptide repeat protein [Chloroflexota bacterium]|nr:tetratricopeptide repeat protein [Chloroflexota bacterium]
MGDAWLLVANLLAACPHLKLLVTSRSLLRLHGEHTFPVAPLAVPDPERLPGLAEVASAGAVALFVQRAAAVRPDFTLAADNARTIVHICAALAGLPLALELAAARCGMLALDELRSLLRDRLALLSDGPRDAPARHQAMRDAIAWSYDLLTPAERTLFRRLAVFAGGWTRDATTFPSVEASGESRLVLDVLARLVEQSLVEVDPRGAVARYRLLEPVRQYAAEQLRAAGEESHARQRHLSWCVAVAGAEGATTTAAYDRFEAEHDNFRAALRWADEQGDAVAGLRLGVALWRFWHARGYLGEGRAWLEALLERTERQNDVWCPLPLRQQALLGAGVLACNQGDQARARQFLDASLAISRRLGDQAAVAESLQQLATVVKNQAEHALAFALVEECLELRRQLGDERGAADALHRLGSLLREVGQYPRAIALLEESLRLFRKLGERDGEATVLNTLGKTVRDQGDYARAVALHEASLVIGRDLDNPWSISNSLRHLGLAVWCQGDAERAGALVAESLALAEEIGDRWGIAGSLLQLGRLARQAGQEDRALRLTERSLALCRRLDDAWGSATALHALGLIAEDANAWDRAAGNYRAALALARRKGWTWGVADCLEGLARSALGQGQPQRAARLFGAAAGLRATLKTPIPPPERALNEQSVVALRARLGDNVYAVARGAGQSVPLEQVIDDIIAAESEFEASAD